MKDRMELVGSNLTRALTENYGFEIDAHIPEENRLIIKNLEEDIDVSGSTSSSGGVGARIRDYVKTRLPDITCVDAIILLNYKQNLYSISGSESGQNFSPGVVLSVVTWNPTLEDRLIPVGNVVAHELGHGFGLFHINDVASGDDFCNKTQITIEAFGLAETNDCSAIPPEAVKDHYLLELMCKKASALVTENYFSSCHLSSYNLSVIQNFVSENPEIFNPDDVDCMNIGVIMSSNVDELYPDVVSCKGDNVYTYTTTLINDDFIQRNDLFLKLSLSSAPSNPTIFIEDNNFFYHTPTLVRSHIFNLAPGEVKELTINFLIPPGIPEDRITLNTGLWKYLPFPSTVDEFVQISQAVDIMPRYSIPIVQNGETVRISDLIEDLIIPAASLNADWLIDGTLIIDRNYKINSTGMYPALISMDVSSKIIIENASLTLNGIAIKNCRNAMWEGIEVKNNGYLIMDSTSVHNAVHGIKSEPFSQLSITNSEFYNNHIGIDISAVQSGVVGTSDLNQFFGNKIHSDGNLLWPHEGERTLTGLVLRDNDAAVLGIVPPVNNPGNYLDATTTIFQGLTNGIMASNCNMQVSNTLFTDITGYGIHLDHGSLAAVDHGVYSKNTFTQVDQAIFATNANLHIVGQDFFDVGKGVVLYVGEKGITTVEDNTFQRFSERAIEFFFVEDFQIHNNELELSTNASATADGIGIGGSYNETGVKSICNNRIILENGRSGILGLAASGVTMTDNGIRLGPNSRSGIQLQGGSGCQIEGNRVSNFTTDNTAKGIFIKGTTASTYGCNNLSDNETGINFFGACDGTDFKGSNIRDATRGLTLGLYPGPNIEGTIIEDQDHRGNEWNGSYGDVGAYFVGNELDAQQSKFFVDEGVNTEFYTAPNIPNWFVTEADQGLSYLCPNTPPSTTCDLPGIIQEGPFPTELDEQIAGDLTTPGFTSPTTVWILNRHLVQRMGNGHSALDPMTANNYLNASANESYLKLNEVAELITNPTSDSQYHQNVVDIANHQSNIQQKLTSIGEAYQQWYEGTLDDQQLASSLAQHKDAIGSLRSNQESLITTNNSIIQQRLANATTLNNSFTTTLLPAQNEQTINGILIAGITANDINTIETIAAQCPLDGGDAVYTARGLLSSLGHSFTGNDAVTCAVPENRQAADEITTTNNINLYPNPVNDHLTITGYTNEESSILTIYNWTGAKVQQIKLEKGTISKSISTKDWPNGIYYYSTNEKDAETHKLVVTH